MSIERSCSQSSSSPSIRATWPMVKTAAIAAMSGCSTVRLRTSWFERLTGFAEVGYADTRSRLEVVGRELRSHINGCSYGIGELELVSLQSLRERASSGTGLSGGLTVR